MKIWLVNRVVAEKPMHATYLDYPAYFVLVFNSEGRSGRLRGCLMAFRTHMRLSQVEEPVPVEWTRLLVTKPKKFQVDIFAVVG